jgi:SAM-dependent methyltransferase
MTNFGLYAKYYDLLYRDKDYNGESAYVLNLIARYGACKNPSEWRLLELGCGSGGHAAHLAPAIKELVGVERSDEMVAQAQQKMIPHFHILNGDVTKLADILPSEYLSAYFDAVVSLFHVVSYINENDELLNCFQSAYNTLKAGGVFVFDVWFTPAVYWLRPEKRVREMKDDAITVERNAISDVDVMKNVVTVNFTTDITDNHTGEKTILDETHPMRCFSVPEVALLAKNVGFSMVCAEEFVTGKAAGVDTWGVCFVLKK